MQKLKKQRHVLMPPCLDFISVVVSPKAILDETIDVMTDNLQEVPTHNNFVICGPTTTENSVAKAVGRGDLTNEIEAATDGCANAIVPYVISESPHSSCGLRVFMYQHVAG